MKLQEEKFPIIQSKAIKGFDRTLSVGTDMEWAINYLNWRQYTHSTSALLETLGAYSRRCWCASNP